MDAENKHRTPPEIVIGDFVRRYNKMAVERAVERLGFPQGVEIGIKGGLGSGNWHHVGRPGKEGGSGPGRSGAGHSLKDPTGRTLGSPASQEVIVDVGITSARPGKTPFQVRQDMDEFEASMRQTGVRNLSVKIGVGGYEKQHEPTWITSFSSDGEIPLAALAAAGKKYNQDSVLVMRHVKEGGSPQVHLDFSHDLDSRQMGAVENVLRANEVGGWTWHNKAGRTSLMMACIPQWGGESEAHLRTTRSVQSTLKKAGVRTGYRVKQVDITILDRDNYDSYIGGAHAN